MKTLEELIKKRDKINKQIEEFKDKFKYAVVVHSYGSHNKYEFNNFESAKDLANQYYEDNGYAHIFTNNPNIKEKLNGGNVYFILDVDSVDDTKYPKNAIIIKTINR